MAIVGRTKYTRAREISRRDAKGVPRLLELSRARVYFARPTIAIAKIRDYSQSTYFRVLNFMPNNCMKNKKVSWVSLVFVFYAGKNDFLGYGFSPRVGFSQMGLLVGYKNLASFASPRH